LQTRILSCLAGGLLGVTFASTLNVRMGLTPTLAVFACSLAGVALGYLVSILYDVFAGTGKNHLNTLK
jgi:hypothetical protein